MTLAGKNILLVISGGIAAYKSLELIRLIRKAGGNVITILTQGGAQFVTPLSIAALSENPVYTDLFSLKDEAEMGHIRLSREADLIIVAPASANLIARLAQGRAEDLASTALLAANKKIMIAPAMNHVMWENEATRENIEELVRRDIKIIGPVEGEMACKEYGMGRMVEPIDIFTAIEIFFAPKALQGVKALVTAGPTFEPIDPVRFIGNRSSGKQGYEIAKALRDYGADVTLISGPASLPAPSGIHFVSVQTADEMLNASLSALPAEIAICAAAVADWKPDFSPVKIKKEMHGAPELRFTENPDILKSISAHSDRPSLVVGFAAETENAAENAAKKLKSKACDWILGNQVGDKSNPVFGMDENEVILVTSAKSEKWPRLSKRQVAENLVQEIISHRKGISSEPERKSSENRSIGNG